MDRKILEEYGVDFESGLERFMGNEEFYSRMLAMFLNDSSFSRMKTAYDKGDCDELFGCAHEFKSVSGSVSLTALYEADCRLVEYLRSGGRDRAVIDRLFSETEKMYEKYSRGIKLAINA